jgi:hypothetical protein
VEGGGRDSDQGKEREKPYPERTEGEPVTGMCAVLPSATGHGMAPVHEEKASSYAQKF